MLTAIPLTIVPLILFNVLGYALGGAPWSNVLFTVPLMSGLAWSITIGDLIVLLGLLMLFFETLRSAQASTSATIANHIISTILLIV
jgi:tetrahydromethanopterin S-methyltransferase subunit C